MMNFDEIDIQILTENFDEKLIQKIDYDNAFKIYRYLEKNEVYYAKDLFLNCLDLFLLPYNIFIKKFEYLKSKLGNDFVEKLASDFSLIDIMYE